MRAGTYCGDRCRESQIEKGVALILVLCLSLAIILSYPSLLVCTVLVCNNLPLASAHQGREQFRVSTLKPAIITKVNTGELNDLSIIHNGSILIKFLPPLAPSKVCRILSHLSRLQ
ncbi:hypothetical protein HD806DRAFT_488831 [Xylariaceae sp. AK1471]|nr:hypothetical protein HD806DRAFT_488831 [Xylariaceae sp. AK1471]